MEEITSKSNEKVKFIKSLNEKKYRKQHNAFYLEGVKVVSEVIDSYINKAINIMFIAYSYEILKNVNGGEKIYEKIFELENNGFIKTIRLSSQIFEHITDTVTTQGVLAVIEFKNDNDNLIKDELNGNILILDSVQDAGNLGTIIRTADAFDVRNIFCTENTVDVYSQKALRSTMGSILRVNVKYIEDEKIQYHIKQLKDFGYIIAATSLEANRSTKEIDLNNKYAFVLGNEANGVSDKIIKFCDESYVIPMSSSAESLNVSVAAGIILYEQYLK